MNILYSRLAAKALDSMIPSTKQRILNGISGIPNGDIKKLKKHTSLYRLRIGDWRIVFSYPDRETVLIERISLRGEIYKEI